LKEELEGVRGADGVTPKLFLKRGERGVGRCERSGRSHTKVVFEEGRERTRGRVVRGRGLGQSHGKGVVEREVVVLMVSCVEWWVKEGVWHLLIIFWEERRGSYVQPSEWLGDYYSSSSSLS
jgi:hypothetical protein